LGFSTWDRDILGLLEVSVGSSQAKIRYPGKMKLC